MKNLSVLTIENEKRDSKQAFVSTFAYGQFKFTANQYNVIIYGASEHAEIMKLRDDDKIDTEEFSLLAEISLRAASKEPTELIPQLLDRVIVWVKALLIKLQMNTSDEEIIQKKEVFIEAMLLCSDLVAVRTGVNIIEDRPKVVGKINLDEVQSKIRENRDKVAKPLKSVERVKVKKRSDY